jgi:4-aminobutyrate aminotransferase-like enzyme/Ser/Thr protein kinase RdoA (MazF antagonist)
MSQAFTNATIRQLAQEHFQLTITEIKPLAGEVDLNFRLTAEDGQRYTMKISQPEAEREAIEFERAIMQHLYNKQLNGGMSPQELLQQKPVESFDDALESPGLNLGIPAPVGPIIILQDSRLLRLQTWVAGKPLAMINPITSRVRRDWGQVAGLLTEALADFEHPHAPTDYKWNPSQTLECRPLARFFNKEQSEIANYFWTIFEQETLPALSSLPVTINYNDAHDQNLLVNDFGAFCGVIDFGDAMRTQSLNELAIACAYAGMNTPDPLLAMQEVATGFGSRFIDTSTEHLFNLITARLLITVATAAENAALEPENEYLQVSAAPAWAVLKKLRELPPRLANAVFRNAIWQGEENTPRDDFDQWLEKASPYPVIDLTDRKVITLDLSVGSLDLGNHQNYEDIIRFTRRITRHLEDKGADFGIGGYGETRPVYTTDDFAEEGNSGPLWRTVHLGLDVWGPADTPIYAPFNGTFHSLGIDATKHGYGHVLILEHHEDELTFYTLYGHLTAASVANIQAGTQVQKGDEIARFGAPGENGGWPPHLHFQVILDMLGYVGDFPGVAYPQEASVWLDLCPDPQPFFKTDLRTDTSGFDKTMSAWTDQEGILMDRHSSLGYSLSVSYKQPLHIVRGVRQYLLDTSGRRYLDTVNNVAHVGHQHQKVVEAIQRQAAVLNTNARYLHENITRFAEKLTATMPPELSVVHFVNSGSEANELAMRMSEAWSGTQNMLAVEVGYHGNTSRTIDVSSYKFDGKGGKGAPPRTRLLSLPDVFRGIHRDPATAGKAYGAYAGKILREWEATGAKIGGFIGESILSCGGQIVLPEGYLEEVYRHVRAAGGLCIADEVQVGVGRVGSHFWGFELQGVVPDIVTIGKPLGNGHPLGAVVCTPEVARVFANGMEYFNTFGGNAVSCAAGLAVLDVVKEEGLQQHALETGNYLKTLLRQLQAEHPIIGDVRGEGLFLGFELVKPSPAPAAAPDHGLLPATSQAGYLKNRMRELGFLMSTDGPDENVIKIKPPMCFDRKNADQLVGYLDRVLGEDHCQ